MLKPRSAIFSLKKPVTNENIRGLLQKHKSSVITYRNEEFENYGFIEEWDTSQITDMSLLFNDYTTFNLDISKWDVSHVTNMSQMFKGLTNFDQDISGWDVSKVNDMSEMFKEATSFNQDISGWDVSKVNDMSEMFKEATNFNQELRYWNLPSNVNLNQMFLDSNAMNENYGNKYGFGVTPLIAFFNENPWQQLGNDDQLIVEENKDIRVSISKNGNRIAVANPKNSIVDIYEWNTQESRWDNIGKLIGESKSNNFGQSVSLNNDGSRIAIGVPNHFDIDTTTGNYLGKTIIYEYNSASDDKWSKKGQALLGDSNQSQFGYSVSLSSDGSVVAVGAPEVDETTSIYKFNDEEDKWKKLGEDITFISEDDKSGYSVSLNSNGTRVIIGSPNFVGGLTRVFEYNETNNDWMILANSIESISYPSTVSQNVGHSVSINNSGSIIAISSTTYPTTTVEGRNKNGNIRVFELKSEWQQVGNTIYGININDKSGNSISLSDNGYRLAVGDENGKAHVYELNGSIWSPVSYGMKEEDNDSSFYNVSLNGDGTRVIFGNKLGNVRVYDFDRKLEIGSLENTDIEVVKGWSMIGFSKDGRLSQGASLIEPGKVIWFDSNTGSYKSWNEDDDFKGNRGYWVKCNAPGTLSFTFD